MDAIDPRTVPTGARKRANVMFSVATGTDVFKPVMIVGFDHMSQIIGTFLATKTFVVETRRLTLPSLQACDGSPNRTGDGAES